MNVLGHAGLTLAAAYSADQFLQAWLLPRRSGQRLGVRVLAGILPRWSAVERRAGLHPVDYRLAIVGALLPDIIDKPLGFWLAPELVNHSVRSIGHTAAFAFLLLVVALVMLWLWHQPGLLVLAATSVGHLLFDQMWQLSQTLLWPARGWAFPLGTTTLSEWWIFHLHNVPTSAPELLGGVVLLAFAIKLYRRKALRRFVKSGAIT